MKRRYTGDYAREIKVGDAYAQLAPGDFVELSAEDEGDVETKELIDNGTLIDASGGTAKPTTALPSKEGGDK
jgi:hypothetical protein